MSGGDFTSNYNDSFSERRDRAAEARKAMLERYRAKPDANDPAVQARAAPTS